MNPLLKLKAWLRLRRAIDMADRAHTQTGHRFFVIPGPADNRSLLVIDRKNFRLLKKKHYISGSAKTAHLFNESFYFTPDRAGHGSIDPDDLAARKQAYYKLFANK